MSMYKMPAGASSHARHTLPNSGSGSADASTSSASNARRPSQITFDVPPLFLSPDDFDVKSEPPSSSNSSRHVPAAIFSTAGEDFSSLDPDEQLYIFRVALAQAGISPPDDDSDGDMGPPSLTPEQTLTTGFVCAELAHAHHQVRDRLGCRIVLLPNSRRDGASYAGDPDIVMQDMEGRRESASTDTAVASSSIHISSPIVHHTYQHHHHAPSLAPPLPSSEPKPKSGDWLRFSELRPLDSAMLTPIPESFVISLRSKHYLPLNMFSRGALMDQLWDRAPAQVEIYDPVTGAALCVPDTEEFHDKEISMIAEHWSRAYPNFARAMDDAFGPEIGDMWRDWHAMVEGHPLYTTNFPFLLEFDINVRRIFFRGSRPFLLNADLLEWGTRSQVVRSPEQIIAYLPPSPAVERAPVAAQSVPPPHPPPMATIQQEMSPTQPEPPASLRPAPPQVRSRTPAPPPIAIPAVELSNRPYSQNLTSASLRSAGATLPTPQSSNSIQHTSPPPPSSHTSHCPDIQLSPPLQRPVPLPPVDNPTVFNSTTSVPGPSSLPHRPPRSLSMSEPSKPYDRDKSGRHQDRRSNEPFCPRCGRRGHTAKQCDEQNTISGGTPLCRFESGRLITEGPPSRSTPELCFKYNNGWGCQTPEKHEKEGMHRCSLCLEEHSAKACPSLPLTGFMSGVNATPLSSSSWGRHHPQRRHSETVQEGNESPVWTYRTPTPPGGVAMGASTYRPTY